MTWFELFKFTKESLKKIKKADFRTEAGIIFEHYFKMDRISLLLNGQNNIEIGAYEKIKEINKTMPNYKFIKEVHVTTEPLIKTTTLKIKRFEEMKKMGIDAKPKTNKVEENNQEESKNEAE